MVRVRIAPSPTGNPHVGTAYIGILNMLFAKANNGKLILRIEDTDKSRCKPDHEEGILHSLNWLGIKWDEGPDVGGDFGPYTQSERSQIYKKYIEELLIAGKAYKCFCTAEDLMIAKSAGKQSGSFGYSGFCRSLTEEESEDLERKGRSYVVRLRTPNEGNAVWEDLVKGKIEFPYSAIDDQVLMKSDGMPTYHFANVVDDYLMNISHVLRGDEWISSTPKHMYLYEAFGWNAPNFGHLPLLLDENGKKLSKRKNPTSIDYYKKAGFSPETLINFLISISYNDRKGREIFDFSDIVPDFNIKDVGKSSAIFDIKKLEWVSQERTSKEDVSSLTKKLNQWLIDIPVKELIELAIVRSKNVSDVLGLVSNACSYDESRVLGAIKLYLKKEDIGLYVDVCDQIILMSEFNCWNSEYIKNKIKSMSGDTLVLKKHIMPVLFVAMYGNKHGLPVFKTMEILGKDVSINRINTFKKLLNF